MGLGMGWGGALWRLSNLALFALGCHGLLKRTTPKSTARQHTAMAFIGAGIAWTAGKHGQATLAMSGLVMLSLCAAQPGRKGEPQRGQLWKAALALALAVTACGKPATPAAPAATEMTADQKAEISKALNDWFDVKYEETLQRSPVMLTFLGRKDKNDQIDCFTRACGDENLALQKAAVEEMKAKFNYDDLSDADKLSWDLFEYQYEQAAEAAKYRYNGFVYDQMNGPQGFIPQFLISFHNVEDASDMRAYVSRIREAARASSKKLWTSRGWRLKSGLRTFTATRLSIRMCRPS